MRLGGPESAPEFVTQQMTFLVLLGGAPGTLKG